MPSEEDTEKEIKIERIKKASGLEEKQIRNWVNKYPDLSADELTDIIRKANPQRVEAGRTWNPRDQPEVFQRDIDAAKFLRNKLLQNPKLRRYQNKPESRARFLNALRLRLTNPTRPDSRDFPELRNNIQKAFGSEENRVTKYQPEEALIGLNAAYRYGGNIRRIRKGTDPINRTWRDLKDIKFRQSSSGSSSGSINTESSGALVPFELGETAKYIEENEIEMLSEAKEMFHNGERKKAAKLLMRNGRTGKQVEDLFGEWAREEPPAKSESVYGERAERLALPSGSSDEVEPFETESNRDSKVRRVLSAAGRAAGSGVEGAGRGLSNVKNKFTKRKSFVEEAIEEGLKQLREFAKQEFEKIKSDVNREIASLRSEELAAAQRYRESEEEYSKFLRELKTDGSDSFGIPNIAGGTTEIVKRIEKLNPEHGERAKLILENMKERHEDLENVKKQINEKISHLEEMHQGNLRSIFRAKAVEIAGVVGRKYNLDPDEHQTVKDRLLSEADILATNYVKEVDSSFLRGEQDTTRKASRMVKIGVGSRKFFETVNIIIESTWNFIITYSFGVVIAILSTMLIIGDVIFRVLNFTGAGTIFGLIIPIVLAILTLLMGLGEGKSGLIVLGKKLISGWLIGTSTVLFTAFLLFTISENLNPTWFIIMYILIGIIIFSQFYIIGGDDTILPLAAIALLVGFIAFSQLTSGEYNKAVDQFRSPIGQSLKLMEQTFADMWLILTNPTEWYAKQQITNVRSTEAKIVIEGVEVGGFDVLPDRVPLSTEGRPSYFAVFGELENRGEQKASNIRAELTCNPTDRCEFISPECSPVNCISIKNGLSMDLTGKLGIMEKGESAVVRFNQIRTMTEKDGNRLGEQKFVKAELAVKYKYSTSSSLKVTVASDQEIERLQKEGYNIFTPQVASGDTTPAQISLNVGPQPLQENINNMILLVSVLNNRQDGEALLKKGSSIKVMVPDSVKEGNFICDFEGKKRESSGDKIQLQFTTDSLVKYRSPYSFFCTFRTKNVEISQTGVITASLDNYEYSTAKSKSFTLIVPLGILGTESGSEDAGSSSETTDPLVGG